MPPLSFNPKIILYGFAKVENCIILGIKSAEVEKMVICSPQILQGVITQASLFRSQVNT